MTAFDAGTAVEPMDYDFTTVPNGKGKGTVPEPSTKEMKDFQKEFAQIMRDGQKLDLNDDAALKMSDKQFEKFQAEADAIGVRLDVAIAKLCKNQPSEEEVATLPFRVKTAFSKWLMDQFSPEGGASATSK
jgi:hypothetical protein